MAGLNIYTEHLLTEPLQVRVSSFKFPVENFKDKNKEKKLTAGTEVDFQLDTNKKLQLQTISFYRPIKIKTILIQSLKNKDEVFQINEIKVMDNLSK